MDWNTAIERQHAALLSILAMLVALAAGGAGALPRHLHRQILRLLRPAEAATRRLIIALAHTLPALEPQKGRLRMPPSSRPTILRNGIGTGIVMPRGYASAPRPPRQKLSLPLLDPLRPCSARRRAVAAGVPRISAPGQTSLFVIARRGSLLPDDPIDASRLKLRLRAVLSALNDLPAAARRFSRWRARAQLMNDRKPRRSSPLRPGRPPGWSRNSIHPVDEVLKDTHWLAWTALERRDTS